MSTYVSNRAITSPAANLAPTHPAGLPPHHIPYYFFFQKIPSVSSRPEAVHGLKERGSSSHTSSIRLNNTTAEERVEISELTLQQAQLAFHGDDALPHQRSPDGPELALRNHGSGLCIPSNPDTLPMENTSQGDHTPLCCQVSVFCFLFSFKH